jgi:hypothetical protein
MADSKLLELFEQRPKPRVARIAGAPTLLDDAEFRRHRKKQTRERASYF